MSPELSAAIEDAYRVFARYRIGGDLVVCHCNCCMAEEAERELVATPLRNVPSPRSPKYTNSAHGYDEGRIADELRYFLPRYLELIAAGDRPSTWASTSACAVLGPRTIARNVPPRRQRHPCFPRCLPRACSLPAARARALACALAPRLRHDGYLDHGSDGGRRYRLAPATWADAPDPPAAVHMAALRESVIEQSDRTYLSFSGYLEDDQPRPMPSALG